MELTTLILQEFEEESAITLRVLKEIENDVFEFSAHKKSMKIKELANHMLLIPNWVPTILSEAEFDWAHYAPPGPFDTIEELLAQFSRYTAIAIRALEEVNDFILKQPWTMRKEFFMFFTIQKHEALRKLVLNHMIHHRAQMGVYLRLNNLKVPANYIVSADENLYAYPVDGKF